MKKRLFLTLAVCAGLLTGVVGCKGSSADDNIYVITREDGSGTRSAFIEIMGIEQKDEDGNKVDKTIGSAEESNSTAVMLTTVQNNENAIGYVSLGSLDESKVKALKIENVTATQENVKDGTYKVSRPFNIATKEDLSDEAKDFMSFILSSEGQKVVEEAGYTSLDIEDTYKKSNAKGKVVVGGSSSVAPVMESLIENYKKVNSDITVELQTSDSTTGMNDTISGILDIGMASRELKESEISKGLKETKIAIDGIAVIVNKENKIDTLTKEQVMKIYTGEITSFGDVEK